MRFLGLAAIAALVTSACSAPAQDLSPMPEGRELAFPWYAASVAGHGEASVTVLDLSSGAPVESAVVELANAELTTVQLITDAFGFVEVPEEFAMQDVMDVHVRHGAYRLSSWLGVMPSHLTVGLVTRSSGPSMRVATARGEIVIEPTIPLSNSVVFLRDSRIGGTNAYPGVVESSGPLSVDLPVGANFLVDVLVLEAGSTGPARDWSNVVAWGAADVIEWREDSAVTVQVTPVERNAVTLTLDTLSLENAGEMEWWASIEMVDGNNSVSGALINFRPEEDTLQLTAPTLSSPSPNLALNVVIFGRADHVGVRTLAHRVAPNTFEGRDPFRPRRASRSQPSVIEFGNRDPRVRATKLVCSYGNVAWSAVAFDARTSMTLPTPPEYEPRSIEQLQVNGILQDFGFLSADEVEWDSDLTISDWTYWEIEN